MPAETVAERNDVGEELRGLDGRGPGQRYTGRKARAADGSHCASAAARAGDHISTLALKPP